MDYKHKQLELELSALTKVFSELGARLSEVAKEVTSAGIMPSEKVLEQISTSRTSFENVRTAVHSHAGAMLVSPLPKVSEVTSVASIDALLKAAAAAEETKFIVEAEREKALGILGRALSITHRETADFKPLQESHAKLGELRNAIGSVQWPHRHPDSESIINSKHPSNALLAFIEHWDSLDDDKWMALETTITESYGKPLFVAASRGKLVIAEANAEAPQVSKPAVAQPAAAAPVPPAVKPPAPAPEAPKPVAVEKPVEKKLVAEKPPEKPAAAAPPAPVPAPAPASAAPTLVEKKPAPQPAPAVAIEKKEAVPERPSPKPVATPPAPVSPERKESNERPHPVPVAAPAPPAPAPAPAAVASAPPAPVPVSAPPAVAAAPPVAAVSPAPVAAAPVAPPRPPAPVPVAAPSAPAVTASAPPPVVVNAASAPAAPPVPAAPVAAAPNVSHSLAALATATEPAVEKKPAAASGPVDIGEKQRKEPRLAVPAPQPMAKVESKAPEANGDDGRSAAAGDPSQRPQRWGFWRGNR